MTRLSPPLIQAIACASDDAVRARLLRDGARDLMARPAGIATIVAVALDGSATDTSRAVEMLLGAAFDEACMAGDATAGMPTIEALIGPLIAEIGDAPLQVHAALAEPLAGLQRRRPCSCP